MMARRDKNIKYALVDEKGGDVIAASPDKRYVLNQVRMHITSYPEQIYNLTFVCFRNGTAAEVVWSRHAHEIMELVEDEFYDD